MPKRTVDTGTSLEHLSILDETGNVDRELEPDLSKDLLLKMHEKMLLTRRFDERMLSLQRQGRLGTFAPVKGQEAAQIGTAAATQPSDWIVPSYREIAVFVWRELPLEGMLVFNSGYNEGGRMPRDRHFLPIAVPVGTQTLHAAGLAYGRKLKGKDEIVLTFFGDGATSEGDVHEALNFAGVFRCPVVFICQNNQYAISVPRFKQTSSKTLAQKAFAYNIPCVQVDGNDVLAVYTAAKQAADRAREEHMPTFIECLTYRMSVHTTVDDPTKYRSQEEVQEWEKRDPISRFQAYLKGKGLLSDADIERVEEAVEGTIEQAVDAWQKQLPSLETENPVVMFDHLYDKMPPSLQEQRETFQKEWSQRTKEQDDG